MPSRFPTCWLPRTTSAKTWKQRHGAEHLRQFLARSLTDREREVVELRYGLRNCLPLTQREVAARLDISRSYVSRIEKRALSVLRREFEREQRGC